MPLTLIFYRACDYNGHMIKSLRESKAHLSELVERAARGEEIIISVRGKPKARLGPVSAVASTNPRQWVKSLKETRAKYTVRIKDSSAEILDAVRGDRV